MKRTHGAWSLLAALLAIASTAAAAETAAAAAETAAPTPLDGYLDGLKSLHTDFTQQVVDAHGAQVESGSGKLSIARPGRFRWEYTPKSGDQESAAGAGGAQLLVADGRNLWFYDRELMQVTVKPITAALGATPVALLSGTAGDLRGAFSLATEPAHDGLEWVQVKPRSAEADFEQAELGFKARELVSMVIEDKLGQHATLRFTHSQRNARLAATEFDFRPPPGADLIGTPQTP